MNYKNIHKLFGAFVFIASGAVYFLTVQPSVSLWDCGEFIASAYGLQVPHPPGTPFFILLGRIFSMIPFAENIAFRVNTMSVLSSTFVVLFVYLVAVKLIENFKGKTPANLLDALGTYIAASIGALSLAFSDTFWFNAVEAEVYALSTFFIAFVTWMMLIWNEKADEPDNEKYLLMIAYLIGLSIGVHLMSLLAIVPIVMTIMFRKYITDESQLKKSGIYFLAHAVIILLIAVGLWASATDTNAPFPEEYMQFDQRFVMIVGLASVIFMGVLWRRVFNINSIYLPFIIGGLTLFAIYPGFVKYVPLILYEVSGNNFTMNVLVVLLLLAAMGLIVYWSHKRGKETLNFAMSFIMFAFIGYSSYAMIMIRSNQETPINLNSPQTMSEMFSYVNREQYGDFPTFKRRFSQEPHQQHIYTQYSSDLDFFWRYQMNHMFNRYLLWNYVGRDSTYQDSNINFTDLLAIPFLLGILGLYYHFRKDWKMASIFLTMFVFLGYLTAFYQNQQEPQPRERDYFYVGAFFVFSLWIALGTRGIFDVVFQYFKGSSLLKPIFTALTFLFLAGVPGLMLKANYNEHDRSRNYIPWDYAYNMLQSVAPNAVLFTNGDNDTFPLWYLQEVEGVRQDVRIANLSLLNTPWYILQLKNLTPHGSMNVPMTMTDEQIYNIGPMQWEPKTMSVEVPRQIIEKFSVKDTAVINNNAISWTMNNTAQIGRYKAVRVQDIVALDIIKASKWERPVYFAVTCSGSSMIGLDDYLMMEGLALRLVPEKSADPFYYVNEPILRQQLFDEPEGYSRDYQPGFKYRSMADPSVFLDENHERLVLNYRNSYLRLSIYYLEKMNDKGMALNTLNEMEKNLPRSRVPMRYEIMRDLSYLYIRAGGFDQYEIIARELEQICLAMIEKNPRDYNRDYNPYLILRDIYENLEEFDKLVELFTKLQSYLPNDPTVNSLLNRYRKMTDQPQESKRDFQIEDK